mmetsp:Transcript_21179/g.31605  ORF Transcript_21179/g.31605 Transcript_21179/m.31605 type:complete len:105 (-) Transcript_21179:1186-1500(-)
MPWDKIHQEVLLAENEFQKNWPGVQEELRKHDGEASADMTDIARIKARMKVHPNQVAKELYSLKQKLAEEHTTRKTLEEALKAEKEKRIALEERLHQLLQVNDG